MKTKITILLALSLVAGLIFTSCDKDDETTPKEKVLYPSALTRHEGSESWTSTFEYDTDKKLVKIDYYDDQYVTFEYNATGNLSKINQYYNGNIFEYDSLEYNTTSQLVKVWCYENSSYKNESLTKHDVTRRPQKHLDKSNLEILSGFSLYGWETYKFDDDGNVARSDYYSNEGVKEGYSKFEYDNNGNVIHEEHYLVKYEGEFLPDMDVEYSYTYDNKKNVFKALNFPFYWNLETNVNNVVGVTRIDYEDDEINSWANIYEYNEDNYPVKITHYDGEYEVIVYQEL